MTDDTATIERDLAALESVLAGAPADHADPVARELQELALELRADAPRPAAAFSEELRKDVEAGFPRVRQRAALDRLAARAARGPDALARKLLPVAGVVVPLVLIVVVVFAVGGPPSGGGGDGAGAGGGGVASDSGGAAEIAPNALEATPGETSGDAVAKSRSRDTGAPAQPVPPGNGFVPGQRNRSIERSFSLELEVPLDDMARVADGVTAVTNRHGGFVLNSSVSTGEDGGGGDFSLRIPTDRLRPALRDLAELAPVLRQSQEGRDVTREHVTAKDRLQAARAERRSLLRRLEQATTDEEAEAIRTQLDLVAGEINGLRGQLRDLRLRTDYAVVAVSLLVADDKDGGAGAGGSFDDAVGDAGDLLVGFAGVLIRVLALGLPLALIALGVWLGARGFQRRRRESALA